MSDETTEETEDGKPKHRAEFVKIESGYGGAFMPHPIDREARDRAAANVKPDALVRRNLLRMGQTPEDGDVEEIELLPNPTPPLELVALPPLLPPLAVKEDPGDGDESVAVDPR